VKVDGVVRPPGDKTVTHLALMTAALTRSRVTLLGPLTSPDVQVTARVLRQVGTEVSPVRHGRPLTVRGRRWTAPTRSLDCGGSGTTVRLALGALAGRRIEVRLTGNERLGSRSLRDLTIPLRGMGASIVGERGEGLPLRIRGGRLRSFSFYTPTARAQIKAALLLAGVSGGVAVTVTDPARSRDHLERLLGHLGFTVHVGEKTVALSGAPERWPKIGARDLEIPGDATLAAYWVAAATLAERGGLCIEHVGVNPTRSASFTVLTRMGARFERRSRRTVGGERIADLFITPAPLSAVDVSANETRSMIDELPVLAVVASRAHGESRFRAVGDLRVTGGRRLELTAENLRAVGCRSEVQDGDLVVQGTDRPPRGRVETAGDHRLALAFTVLGTLRGSSVELSETASIRRSYPDFFADLERIDVS
jgi:3-phosphoshikimate 1-carboxyvinyltransferase